jgi:oxygen-independent coproporphyrinogen-3 oxidase
VLVPPLGLYIHVPFCSSICHYCNFNRGLLDGPLKSRYVRAVLSEIARAGRAAAGPGADTIYFGGGTPSLLEPDEIGAVVAACRRSFPFAADAEVTLEVNPETVTPERAAAWRAAGVNRLSLGVQSFRDEELARLGRVHDSARARRAIGDVRAAGFGNISLDLMMWLPGQSVGDWDRSVEGVIDAGPEHASLYILELYPNAPLREEMARAGWSQAPDEDAADMYERAMKRLDAAGYRQYEISNVARPGRESRHNLKYWSDGEWLGFGPGAHSTWRGARWKNVAGTEDYVSRIDAGASVETERRTLTALERCQEALITGLRLADGVSADEVRVRYGLDLWARYGEHLQPYLDAGLLSTADGRLRLTRRGMLLANEVLAVFI